jgi:hypothetical protein
VEPTEIAHPLVINPEGVEPRAPTMFDPFRVGMLLRAVPGVSPPGYSHHSPSGK